MKLQLPCLAIFCCFYSSLITAQEKANVKFGDISEKDFANTVYSIDSNASAVIIAETGTSTIEGNTKGSFSLVLKYYRRAHILNKNGFDIASVSIPVSGDAIKLDKLKAVTYNLENGKVVESKLDPKSDVFNDKVNKEIIDKKFTFPNVKEGSIIELEYSIVTDYYRYLYPWEFQGAYPCLWSEYNVSIPSFLYFIFLTQGYLKFYINEHKEGNSSYNVVVPNDAGASRFHRINAGSTDYRWVVRNVPALKEEGYTSTLNNHIQKINFLLVEQKEPLNYYRYVESWQQITGHLLEEDYFGQQLDKENGWMDDLTQPLLKGVVSKFERAKKIYEYIRNHFSCTDYSRRTMDQTLKNLVKSGKGNVAELNLLLTAMLRHEHLDADPVLLSTRSHGITYSVYPILSQYNYVICRAIIDGKTFYLDASEPMMGFGHLPMRCYNGECRLVNKEATAMTLSPDSVTETKITSIFIINDEKGNLVGSLQQTPGYYESTGIREQVKEKGQDDVQKEIKKSYGGEINISNFHIDSLDKYDYELGIHFDFDINDEKEDIIYMNPLFGEGYKENPFKSAERLYPVEMPYTKDATLNLQLEVPQGYLVDELPGSLIVKLNEQEDAVFEYRISQSGDNISLRSRVRFRRSYFLPEEYETLREFFNLIVKKQAEQIVFKKKK